jgi:hypothetical protein
MPLKVVAQRNCPTGFPAFAMELSGIDFCIKPTFKTSHIVTSRSLQYCNVVSAFELWAKGCAITSVLMWILERISDEMKAHNSRRLLSVKNK